DDVEQAIVSFFNTNKAVFKLSRAFSTTDKEFINEVRTAELTQSREILAMALPNHPRKSMYGPCQDCK
ncbi:MAG: hypothetical protein EBX50_16245, partial [Chitinophagia bacterium]|nr:hypothetical protein [Chitinophagia bacterium]